MAKELQVHDDHAKCFQSPAAVTVLFSVGDSARVACLVILVTSLCVLHATLVFESVSI